MGQTVNLLSFDFGGSNPSAPTPQTRQRAFPSGAFAVSEDKQAQAIFSVSHAFLKNHPHVPHPPHNFLILSTHFRIPPAPVTHTEPTLVFRGCGSAGVRECGSTGTFFVLYSSV